MVAKKGDRTKEKKGQFKVGKLKLDKETIKDLTSSEVRKIRGGQAVVRPANTKDECLTTPCKSAHCNFVP